MSTYQQPGRGYRPLALAADPQLATFREAYAPVTLRRYVAPLGNGWHLIQRDCNDAPYEASSSTGAAFREGETVAVVGEGGLRGEIIIGPAATATADYPTVALGLSLSLDIPEPAPANACPAAITGKSYLAIKVVGTEIFAWRYTDGDFQEALGSYDFTAEGWSTPFLNMQRVNSETETVVFHTRKDGTDHIITWDIDGGVVYQLDCDSDHTSGPIWTGGTDVYFSVSEESDGTHLTLHKVALFAAGVVDLVATQQGTDLHDPDGFLQVPDNILLWSAGPKFQIPCFWFETGTEIVVPYWSGGAWTLGTGRAVLAGAEDPGVGSSGYASATGGYAVRVSYDGDVNSNIGLMPTGPGTPEVALIPTDWQIDEFLEISLSPNGLHAAVFPVTLEGGPADVDKLLRLPLSGTVIPSGCPLSLITVEPGPAGVPAFMLCRD